MRNDINYETEDPDLHIDPELDNLNEEQEFRQRTIVQERTRSNL
jgi:hypothetical protein